MVVHRFTDQLARSLAVPNAWWERMYRTLFVDFHSMTLFPDDGIAQRNGIDRVVTLTTGKHYAIDEKVRAKDYEDILLEVYSDKARQTPGWVNKELWADYIAYAIPSRNRCFLLPVPQLRAAWRRHGRAWMERYPTRDAPNAGYVTHNLAVPYDTLFLALDEALHGVPRDRDPGEDDE